jgi:cyclophilin family peptidyl-prolyl cis-trans isomerase
MSCDHGERERFDRRFVVGEFAELVRFGVVSRRSASTIADMLRRCVLLAATSLLVACPAGTTKPPQPPEADDPPLRIRIAQAEARRAGGVAELVDLAGHGAPHQRLLALRALGRIGVTGGPQPVATLIAALGAGESEIVGAAASAIGLAASLDDGDLGATDALLAALPRGGPAVVEALGRAGSVAAQPALVALLGDARLGAHAALALGRHGRRRLELSEASRGALVPATASADPAVRYAAVYALAREFQAPPSGAGAQATAVPPSPPPLVAALVARLGDPVPEIRAQAIAGLARRKAIVAARAAGARLDELLLDRDWRVAVEAVRALGDGDDGRDAIAAAIVRRFAEVEREPTAAHVVIEGARALAGAAQRPVVAAALSSLAANARSATALPALTRGWIECLSTVAIVRARADAELTAVEQCPLTDHLRLPLVAQLISADVGSVATRRAALAKLLGHRDPRVRAAGLGALPALWKAGDATDHRNAISTLVTAITAPDLIAASAAVDAAKLIYETIGAADHTLLDAALVARGQAERDPELGAAILELIGQRTLVAGLDACRAALAGDPVRAKAGVACLKALGEAPPEIPQAAATPPPVDVAAVVGKRLRWRVATSRGDVVIRLHPEVAPWAVATIVALTRKGFYDGIEFHRVVPNFVVQGGDPTESGSGGPGFSIPAEPGALGDGAGYVIGGVGIADAGRDTGGSQWFVMHSRAPHLDGRYTWIGTVESGQKSADALLVGDQVVRASIEGE